MAHAAVLPDRCLYCSCGFTSETSRQSRVGELHLILLISPIVLSPENEEESCADIRLGALAGSGWGR